MALLHVGSSPVVYTDYALHDHNCYEIIMNVEGTGIAEIAGREIPFSPGTIHVIPPISAEAFSKRPASRLLPI